MTTAHLVQRCLKHFWRSCCFTLPLAAQAQDQVRILQTNAAGDRIHIIDPVTNTVVGEIPGIEVAHGATSSPDGRWIYASNEADDTLDVADAQTLDGDQEDSALGPSQQRRDHPRWGASLCGNQAGRREQPRRRGCYRHRLSDQSQEHSYGRTRAQPVRHPGWQARGHRFCVQRVCERPRYARPTRPRGRLNWRTESGRWRSPRILTARPVRYSLRSANSTGSSWWISRRASKSLGSACRSCPPGEPGFPTGSAPSHGLAITADQADPDGVQPVEQRSLLVLNP